MSDNTAETMAMQVWYSDTIWHEPIGLEMHTERVYRADQVEYQLAKLHERIKELEKPVSICNEVAWLIEMQVDGQAMWWYGAGFIADVEQAVRFARAQDAQQVMMEQGLVGSESTEHMWCSHD